MRKIIHDIKICIKFIGNRKLSYIISMISCNAIGSFCYNIVLAIIMQKVLDALAYENGLLFFQALLWAVGTFLFAFIFEPFFTRIKYHNVSSLVQNLRKKIVESMTMYRVQTMEEIGSADLILRVTQDVEKIEQIYLSHIPNLVFAIIHGGTACVIMLWYNVWLGLLSLLVGLMQNKINVQIIKRLERHAKGRQKAESNVLDAITELLNGRVDIIISQSKDFFGHLFKNRIDALYDKEKKSEIEIKRTEEAQNFFGQINNILIMIIGLLMAIEGKITVGTIAAIISLQGNATYLFQNISGFLAGFSNVMPSLERVADIVEIISDKEKEELIEPFHESCFDISSSESVNCDVPAIELDKVCFNYPDGTEVIKNISMVIPQGKTAVIIGKSGKGKSTLAKILLQFYRPSSGNYSVFGNVINNNKTRMARKMIAYLDQNSTIFSLSIRDNLRIVRKDATDAEIVEACKIAEAHEFIMSLPENYDYYIDDSHTNLSGGQCQRLAFARMLLSDRPILLIDEGTASLDKDTEKRIMENLQLYNKHKTIIFFSHHTWLRKYSDMVYEL